MIDEPRIERIVRYPMKGLDGEELEESEVVPGVGLPGDRALGLKFADAPPGWQGKHLFLQLSNTPAIARLRLAYDEASETLCVRRDGKEVLRASGTTEASAVEAFFTEYVVETGGPRRALRLERERFPDAPGFDLSLVFGATLRALAERIGAPFAPERLRMNLVLEGEGLEPFGEFDLVGRSLRAGEVELEVAERLPRCPATHVDPVRGERDLDLLGLLSEWQGHRDLGVFLKVRKGGRLRRGQTLRPA